jgi:hypothetical protein
MTRVSVDDVRDITRDIVNTAPPLPPPLLTPYLPYLHLLHLSVVVLFMYMFVCVMYDVL